MVVRSKTFLDQLVFFIATFLIFIFGISLLLLLLLCLRTALRRRRNSFDHTHRRPARWCITSPMPFPFPDCFHDLCPRPGRTGPTRRLFVQTTRTGGGSGGIERRIEMLVCETLVLRGVWWSGYRERRRAATHAPVRF